MGTANFVYGKPVMQKYTPDAAVAAGDVVIVGALPAVAHVDNPSFGTEPTLDALAIGGGIYRMTTDGTPFIGEDVYFNPTTQKLTATAVGNLHFGLLVAGPSGDLGGSSPAADGDSGFAQHAPRAVGSTGVQAESSANAAATLTAAQLLGGFINSTPAAAITLTLPTAANLVAGVPGAKVGQSFDCSIVNTAGAANTVTLAAGGATLRGGTSVAQNKSALLRILLTNVTSGTEAYTVHAVIGA